MFKDGKYYYNRNGRKFDITIAKVRETSTAFIPTGEQFDDEMSAKIRVYHLNGWSKKFKVTFKTGKVSMYEMPNETDLKSYLYLCFRVPSKNYTIERV